MRLDQPFRAYPGTLVTNVALAALFVFGPAVFASGQTAPPSQPAPAPQVPAGPSMKLSIDEAVSMALEQNLGIQAERLTPQIQDMSIALAQAAFAPTFTSLIQTSKSSNPPSSFLEGSAATISNTSFFTDVGIRQTLKWGGTYTVSLDGSRSETTGFTSFNPTLRSAFDATFTQPLLRNFTIDSARQQLLQSRLDRDVADVRLRQALTVTGRNVRNAYYDLIFAIEGLKVAQQSLDLARESLKNNRARVEVGTMAPIDIVEAEAEVAQREEGVINAEAAIRTGEDRLRALIMDPQRPDFWTVRIEPTDQPTVQPRAIDVEAAVQTALANRTDLVQLRKGVESTDLSLKFLNNQTLPDVNLNVNYGLRALGGTELVFDPDATTFPPPVISQTDRSFASVLRSLMANDFRNWSVNVSIGYPIGRSAAEASLARTRLQRGQALTDLRNAELQVATGVRQVARAVLTNLQRVQSTQAARKAQESRFAAEEKKLAVGLSDTFRVFQAQRDLSAARQNELRAIIDYNKSLIDFEAIQISPLGGF
jgi:outer membrane protein TolC